ncbi:chromosome partition protein Smc-like isoform X4 [Melanotaenia boesemani]|uniref:chromosome partition protein Smc-like isoform X4 n=1 Tax=Melanotaenia boesemani TaxID=1250792 RepID=UPI001C03B43E|nr:chromosome partition protein Smc-like isoform X4 [Melanotaenia boesemani]
MAKSGDHAERFLQEIRAQLVSEGEPAGAIMETWMSLTPQEQVRLLLQILQGKTSPEETRSDQDPEPPAEREQRQGSSRMLEKDGETKMEIMEKQRQLISQIIEDTKKVWEETQRERKETSHLLKTKMELQQDASRLTSEDYDSVKIKLQKFHENMGKLLDNLEVKLTYIQSERAQLEIMKLEVKTERENMERDRKLVKAEMDAMTNIRKSADQKMKELDGKLQIIRTEIRELEVISSEVEIKKKDLVKMIRKSRQKKEDISKLNEKKEEVLEEMGDRKTQSGVQRSELEAMEDITELQQHNRSREITSENNNMTSDMQMEDPDEEEIQEIFHTKQCWKNLEEERSQMKWMNFQVMKKRRELSHQLEKTTRERDELEIMKIKLLHQKQEVDRRMDNIIHTAMTLTEIKDNMKKCAAEMNLTKTEIIKTQKEVEESNSEVKNFKCVVYRSCTPSI